MRYIFAIFVTIILGLPYALDAFAGQIIELQGSKFEVIVKPNGETMLKPVPKESNKPVEFKKKTLVETKVVSTCPDPLGCQILESGDCPDCETQFVREETTEIIETDFMKFKKDVSDRIAFEEMKSEEEVPYYLQPIEYLRIAGHPAYPCYKVQRTCREGAPIDIKDLYASYKVASMCNAMGFSIDFTDPIKSCSRSTIVNL